jgi:hypothetical protein
MNRAMPAVLSLLFGFVASGAALGTPTSTGAASRANSNGRPPSAAEFGLMLVGSANQHAAAHRDPTRLAHADCVQASRGRYMCSYAVVRPGSAECHLIQAQWTPRGASSFTVTLAGRVPRCGSLRDALGSLSGLGAL